MHSEDEHAEGSCPNCQCDEAPKHAEPTKEPTGTKGKDKALHDVERSAEADFFKCKTRAYRTTLDRMEEPLDMVLGVGVLEGQVVLKTSLTTANTWLTPIQALDLARALRRRAMKAGL